MKQIVTIWKKELKDTIRDRRTLMAMIILPMFLMPAIIIGMGKLVEYQINQAEEKTVQIAITNQSAAPEFVEAIKAEEKIEIINLETEPRLAVENEEVDIAIIIPENFSELISGQQPVAVSVLQKSINTDSATALARIRVIATAYNNQLLGSRFAEQSIDQNILNSLVITPEDVATEKETGGFGLGFILPLFIIMWSVVGGQYTAVDISAGEKERKTLESLLLAPVRRIDVVFGKFLAVSTAALISVVVALGSMYAAISIFGPGIFGQAAGTGEASLDFSVEPMAILILFCASILLVLMFSAIQLAIAIFAKSYKEAQSYIGPSYLIIILPTVIVNSIPNFKPAAWFFTLPVVNAILLFKEVLVGEYNTVHIVVTMASLVVYAGISIYLATKIYQREGVLFKD